MSTVDYQWTFSTDAPALAEESWSRMLNETHLPWSVDELVWKQETFSATVTRRVLADLMLVDCSCDPSSGHRDAAELARTDGAFLVLLLTLDGEEVVEQGGKRAHLQTGSVVVWDSEQPAAFALQRRLSKRSLIMPKAALAEFGVRGQLQTGRVLDHLAPAVRLLTGYLAALSQNLDALPPTGVRAARNATIELVTAALQADASSVPTSGTAIRAAAQQHIETNLRDRQLAPASIAHQLGVSVRTLHRSFEGSGLGVAEVIRNARLAAARDELTAGAQVSVVARRWQFADVSHFSRSFKRQFGMPPSALLPD